MHVLHLVGDQILIITRLLSTSYQSLIVDKDGLTTTRSSCYNCVVVVVFLPVFCVDYSVSCESILYSSVTVECL